ncbi:MAG TPA: trypsin-like peptidase domain-containing protein [Dongiaceae bacterium]|nr:trypsin-like peptidase domain-containing protein [Dongiaceae bacterium]
MVLALGCALISACAARPPAPPPAVPVGWQAAIGSLDVTGSPEICTAVLVRSDMIATTSHCLRPKGHFAPPGQLVFTSSALPTFQVRGVAVVAEGGSVAPGSIKPDQAQTDWALVRIKPSITNVRPIALAPISAAMVRAEIAKGARFYSAGYGQGAKDELRAHERCGPLPPDPNGVTENELFFATDCVIRLGDSGGPVILIAGGQPKLIGLIVGFAKHPTTGESIGIVVSAKAFAPYLAADLVSQLFPVALAPEISMN